MVFARGTSNAIKKLHCINPNTGTDGARFVDSVLNIWQPHQQIILLNLPDGGSIYFLPTYRLNAETKMVTPLGNALCSLQVVIKMQSRKTR